MMCGENIKVRELACIRCPLGCQIEVKMNADSKEILEISGNGCQRGEDYASSECTHPERIVTSTVMSREGIPVPVKTERPIPKEKVFDCMQLINSAVVSLPVSAGEVIIGEAFGSCIVATVSCAKM